MKIERKAKLAELAGDTVIGLSIVGFWSLLTLKLIDKIDWSWWAVLAPVYAGIPGGMALTIGIVVALAKREIAAGQAPAG